MNYLLLVILLLSTTILGCKKESFQEVKYNNTSLSNIELIAKELPHRGIYKTCIDKKEYIVIIDKSSVCITQVLEENNRIKICK